MEPICTSEGARFAASVGTSAEAGNDYGCLGDVSNPAWFYLRMALAGDLRTLLGGAPLLAGLRELTLSEVSAREELSSARDSRSAARIVERSRPRD